VDAAGEAFASAGVAKDDVDAYWLGTMASGLSGMTLAKPLKLGTKPVTRLENLCATGSEAFRNACYAVAAGAYDLVMAIGVEKLKDSGYSGLVVPEAPGDGTAGSSPPRPSSACSPRPTAASTGEQGPAEGGIHPHRLEEPPQRGAQPAAQFRKEVAKEVIAGSPIVAGALGIFDCSGVSDGAAAALIVRAEDAPRYTNKPLYVKALSFIAGAGRGPSTPTTTTPPSPRSLSPPRTPTGRRASPTRALSWPWPRCTTASPPPS